MTKTIICADCGYTTDIELSSKTNPWHCPKCAGELVLEGMGVPLYNEDGDYNCEHDEGEIENENN